MGAETRVGVGEPGRGGGGECGDERGRSWRMDRLGEGGEDVCKGEKKHVYVLV